MDHVMDSIFILNQRKYLNVIGRCSLQHAKGDCHRLCAKRFYYYIPSKLSWLWTYTYGFRDELHALHFQCLQTKHWQWRVLRTHPCFAGMPQVYKINGWSPSIFSGLNYHILDVKITVRWNGNALPHATRHCHTYICAHLIFWHSITL